MAQAGRRLSEAEQAAGLVSIARLGRLQPDFVAFSSDDKSIAILDLCRPFIMVDSVVHICGSSCVADTM
jgi:hypothetical protein